MRGKGLFCFQIAGFIGITPAYAGKSLSPSASGNSARDHPRVCGEKFKPFCLRQLCQGSPPRVRGKGRALEGACIPVRITPACAGKRTSTHGMDVRSGDHPRVCGEKHRFKPCNLHQRGSPPRMRGKERLLGSAPNPFGITPAYAGKRTIPQRPTPTWRDHPRVCGEKGNKVKHCFHDLGSPPRMRGKVLGSLAAAHDAGITPAYAGKRTRSSRMQHAHRDHPRVCGEKHG